jgi:hypothetical protein
MTKMQFISFAAAHSRTLMPAFETQKYLRGAFIGPSFWKKATKERQKKTDPSFRASNWRQLQGKLMTGDIEYRKRRAAAAAGPRGTGAARGR